MRCPSSSILVCLRIIPCRLYLPSFFCSFVWTDDWGLHLNVRPRSGCGSWASSEVWLDHALGYGTYLWSYYGPGETLDLQGEQQEIRNCGIPAQISTLQC